MDWTISVCLFTNINHDWPLKAKVTHWDTAEFPTLKGMAGLMNGRVIEHWREPLVCEPEQYVIHKAYLSIGLVANFLFFNEDSEAQSFARVPS